MSPTKDRKVFLSQNKNLFILPLFLMHSFLAYTTLIYFCKRHYLALIIIVTLYKFYSLKVTTIIEKISNNYFERNFFSLNR